MRIDDCKVRGGIDPRSFWLVTTPNPMQLEMPYVCTEAGTLYGQGPFLTERDHKDSYLLFYTFGGEGLVRQGQRAVTVSHGQALLLDCRTPQSYGTSPKRNHWHHLWAHIQGTGVDAAAHRLGLPDLIPISVSTSRIRPHFDTIFERLRGEDVESTELVGMAVHALLSELIMAAARAATPDNDPVRIACEFVVRHFDKPIAVEDLARAASVSPSYLTRLFRQSTGTLPTTISSGIASHRPSNCSWRPTCPLGTSPKPWGLPTRATSRTASRRPAASPLVHIAA